MGKSIMELWISDFLKTKEEPMYKNHCEKFLKYIESVNKENRPNDINKEDIISSVGYYNRLGKINTVSTMTNHLEAIKAFYDKAQKEGKTNNIFNAVSSYNDFKDEITKMYELNDTVEREFLPMETVIALLKHFDDNSSDRDIDFQIIKIYSKLTLIAPAKRQVIAELKFSDFDNDFRRVIINGVEIKIPSLLRRDIMYAINLSSAKWTQDTRLFEHIYDRVYSHNVFNRPLYYELKKIDYDLPMGKNTFSVEALMNTAIIHMIKINTNPALIAKINGVTISTIEKKLLKYGVEIENYDVLINNSLMEAEYFQYI